MRTIEPIGVPTALMFVLLLCAVLFSPLYPVQVTRSGCLPHECPEGDSCACGASYPQLDPPFLVIASGFSWSAGASTENGSYNYAMAANPLFAVMFVPLPVLLLLPLVAKGKSKEKWRRVVLPRRPWRAVLWGYGLFTLVMSGYWAWNYAVFYGGLSADAAIDPLLTSLTATFLLSGLGMAFMMLAVRSRAMWPVETEGRA